MRLTVVFLFLLTFALINAVAECTERSGLAIIRDGQAQAVIVISQNADGQTRKAANVLSEYLRKSTEAQVPIVTETTKGEDIASLSARRCTIGGSADRCSNAGSG